jgi:hypothetical protein
VGNNVRTKIPIPENDADLLTELVDVAQSHFSNPELFDKGGFESRKELERSGL